MHFQRILSAWLTEKFMVTGFQTDAPKIPANSPNPEK